MTGVERGLLAVAVEVVRAAAQLVHDLREHGVSGVATKSTVTDVVTEADKATERFVRDALRARRPGDTVLGEEAGESIGTGQVRWIVDPIDGTVNYLYGLPQYAVSLAAEVDGEVVAGVVRNAANGEEWTATRGGGAYRAGRRLRGSAALDLCFAAEGRVDAYYEKGLNLWDHAAGALIAAEAGLLVTGLGGAAPGPDLVLAAPPGIHAALHATLVALDAAGGP